MIALGLALAVAIGVSLGLLGGGGAILTVPVLVYVLGYAAKPAIAMSLVVVGITSLIGAALHWRLGNVRVGMAITFGLFAMVGAFAGAKLSTLLSGGVQLVLLALVMTVTAVSMLRGARHDIEPSGSWRPTLFVPVALGVGVLTGLVGIGGGFLVVPALVLLARVPMRQAVGTSLLVIAMNTAAGFSGYLGTVDLEWTVLAGFTALAVVGALAGIALSARVPQAALKRGFAVLLLLVGGFVLQRTRHQLHAVAPRDTTPSIAAPAASAGVATVPAR